MSKTKLFFILSALILILVFSVAVVCGQCGSQVREEDKIDVGEEEQPAAAESQEDVEEQPPEEDGQQAQKVEPTINLEVIMGPTYSATDDVCFYRVKAVVSGDPEPKIEWSRDDSNGAWGKNIVQVNLKRGQTHTLVAKATNSKGTAEDSITLRWECDTENNPPQVSEIKIPAGDIFISSVIDVEAVASDPDGDSLSYAWTCDEGTFADEDAKDTQWTAPDMAGDYTVTVTVTDGKGGTDTEDKTITVLPMLGTALAMLQPVDNETGCIATDGSSASTFSVFIGQDVTGKAKEGYLSFNIEGMSGSSIVNAMLVMENPNQGNPREDFGKLILHTIYYGPGDLNTVALGSPNKVFLVSLPNTVTDISYSGSNLTNAIQAAIDNGDPRFQIRIKWEHPAAYGAGTWHGLQYFKPDIYLTVES